MKFQCSACGLCCRKQYLDQLPFDFPRNPVTGDCVALGDDGLCTIYSERPLVCRTADLYDLYGHELDMTRVEFYIAANERCNQMQEDHGYAESFRIDISLYRRKRHGTAKDEDGQDKVVRQHTGSGVATIVEASDGQEAPANHEQQRRDQRSTQPVTQNLTGARGGAHRAQKVRGRTGP